MAQTIDFLKDLVQIEKREYYQTGQLVFSICALFRDSEVLNSTFGCDP